MKIRSARRPVTPKGPTGASAVDPSRTGVLRRGMRRAVDARFRQLEREVEEVTVRYLGQSLSSPQDKIRGFMEWFDGRTEELLFSDDDWWLGPLEACYEKGIGTAFRPLPGQSRQLQEVMLREFVGRVSRRPVSGGGGLTSFLGNSSGGSGCGAGAPGNPGFLPGNTCGAGGGTSVDKFDMSDGGSSITLKGADGKPVGMITIRRITGRQTFESGRKGLEVADVRVFGDHKRKGYATELYRLAWEHAKSKGFQLHVSEVRSDDAKRLHEAFTKKGYKSGSVIDFSKVEWRNPLNNSSNQPRDWRGRWTSSGGLTGYGGKAAMTSYRRLRGILRRMRDGEVGSAKASEAASGIQAGLDRRLQKAFITAWREVRDSASRRFGSGADLSPLRKVFTEGLDTAFYYSATMAGAVRGAAVRGGPVTKGDVRGLRTSRDSLTSALSSTMEQAFATWQTIVPTGNAEGSGRFLVNASLRDVRGRFMSERVNLLATRLENELRGATTAMSQQVARELVSGIEKNLTPRQVARNIVKKVDGIGRTRAMVIANTELVRAHAEGQLDAMAEEGVERVTPAVEWTTAATPCNLCQPLRGIVVTIDEARGMIPRHPNCRCAWRDAKAFRPPSSGRRKLAKSSIEKAIVQSLREEGDVDFDDEEGWGAGRSIGERRPITNEMLEFSRVINSGCGAGAPGHPGFLPGNTCGGENPGKIEIHSDNSRIEVRYGETRTLNLPTGPIEVPGPTAVVSAFIDKGKNQVTLSSIHVDESLRGKGIGSHIIGEVVKESAKKGLPVRTTGVFSQAGKGLMDKLVREGKAVELDGGDYHLISQVINSGCGAGAPGHPGFLPGNVCSQRPQNPLPRVSQQDELRMEMALRKAAGGDTIREFISYSASEENVPLALLHSPQTVKDEKSVKYFKDNPESIDSIQPLPLVIQFGGRMIVRDGNSRAVAAMESGRDSLKVRVVYVPDTGE